MHIGVFGSGYLATVMSACLADFGTPVTCYDDDYARHVDVIRRELQERYPNLHLVGRNGMHKYNNHDHSMMTAMLCVENIVAERPVYDLWRVNQDAEYHEAGTAGQQAATSGLRLVPTKAAH